MRFYAVLEQRAQKYLPKDAFEAAGKTSIFFRRSKKVTLGDRLLGRKTAKIVHVSQKQVFSYRYKSDSNSIE